ncbi:hypothetical protein ACSSS7_003806 [Eimeria intestinalis]
MALIQRGGRSALEGQQLLSILLLLSLWASAVVSGIQAAVTPEEIAFAPVSMLSESPRGEIQAAKREDHYGYPVSPRDDSINVQQLQQQLQQMQRLLLQQQLLLQGMQQQRQAGKQQESQWTDPLHSNQSTVVFGVDDGKHQLQQQVGPVSVSAASERRPVLKGRLLVLLGVVMLLFYLKFSKVDPATKGMSVEETVRYYEANPLKPAQIVSSVLVLLTGLLGPLFILIGAVRLGISLPSYLRGSKDQD